MKKKFFIILCSIFVLSTQLAYAQKIKVVASIFPLGDVARQVGGDKVDIKIMLPPGASEHTYEPTPPEMMELHDAKIFIKVGAGLEFWAEKMIKASSNKMLMVVEATSGLQLIRHIHSHSELNVYEKKGRHVSADPHVWLDPVLMKTVVDKIKHALSKVDPKGAAYYQENAEKYKSDLDALHHEIMNRIKSFRVKEFVTFHAAWNYFSKRYGLKVAGVIEESPGREPSPKHIARIVNKLKKINSKVVFAEPQFNPKIAEVIAKEASAKVLILDPIGGENIKGRETYINLMRYNIAVMEEAMK